MALPLLRTSKLLRIALGIGLLVANDLLLTFLLPYEGQMNNYGVLFHIFYHPKEGFTILPYFAIFIIGSVGGDFFFDINSIKDFKKKIPLTTREDLVGIDPYDLLAVKPGEKCLIYSQTSGSTGGHVPIWVTIDEMEKNLDLAICLPVFQNLIESKDEILKSLVVHHPGRMARFIDKKSMSKLLKVSVIEQASAIDTVVTTDLRRLIRLPNTLHGKTGWLTQKVPIDDLTDYDPLMEAIAFTEGTQKVYIRRAPEISIAGESYGPFEEEAAQLPLAVAMFLLCRKAARVVE